METTTATQIFKGELEFISLFKPIKLYVFKGEIEWLDLWPHINKALGYLDGRNTKVDESLNHYELKHDVDAEGKIKYKNDGKYMAITLNTVTGMSNIGVYLPDALNRLNGRKIIATFTDTSFRIEADPEHKTPEVYYTHNNSCALEADHVKNICKPGGLDTCIFLTLSSENGFMCEKFNGSMSDQLRHRFDEGNMNATRIGSCTLAGRRDAPKPKISLEKYPDLVKLVETKAKYIGWKMVDSGDAMDRKMFGNQQVGTVVTDIQFELDKDQTGANFTIKGKDFDCGFAVEYGGGVRKFDDKATTLHFYGFMGHSFIITKE